MYDAVLATRIRGGDADAETEFVEQFYPRVLTMLTARTRDRDASRDLAQDVMLGSLRAVRAGTVQNPGNLDAFVYGVAWNVASEHFRRTRRRARTLPLDVDRIATDPVETVESRERARRVRGALRRLAAVDRSILRMVFALDMSAVEIAPALGLGVDAVRQRKSRAVRKLGVLLRG